MTSVVQISMQDAAAFHAGLALVASIWANTHRPGFQSETMYHKVECVQIIGSRLNRREPPSEGTIHAIMLLWGLEVRTYKSQKTLITN
jgi:hypothetical protein